MLHLLYARFWHKVLFDLGRVSTKEPFKKLRHQGTVLAHAYRDTQGHYHGFDEVEHRGRSVHLKATGEKLDVSIQKMAKGSLNGVNPDDVVAKHGADALRLYEMFMGDFEQPKPWDPRAFEGMNRFLRRVSGLVEKFADGDIATGDKHLRLRHKTIGKVNDASSPPFVGPDGPTFWQFTGCHGQEFGQDVASAPALRLIQLSQVGQYLVNM